MRHPKGRYGVKFEVFEDGGKSGVLLDCFETF